MSRSRLLWLAVLAVTLVAGWYLRETSPTFPLHGSATLGGSKFHYTLERTHRGGGDQRVRIETRNTEIQGALEWKPLADGEWRSVVMQTDGPALVGSIPAQPRDARVAYRVRLMHVGHEITLPERDPAVLRFR